MSAAEDSLLGRQCLKIPEYLAISNDEYSKVIFEVMQAGWAKQTLQYVISCYSRAMLPTSNGVGATFDIHFLEFLGDLENWYRQKDDQLLESFSIKYLRNLALYHNDFAKATFYDWLINYKGFIVQPFNPDDYKTAFAVNMIALLHESSHFLRGFDEFEALFEERIVTDKYFEGRKPDHMERLKCESKCDFMGLIMILKSPEKLGFTQEQLIEMYFRMIAAMCFHSSFEHQFDKTQTEWSEVDSFIDRSQVVIRFIIGMRELFDGLDLAKVSLETLRRLPTGLTYIGETLQSKLEGFVDEFNSLPNDYSENICREMMRRERVLEEESAYSVYPQ